MKGVHLHLKWKKNEKLTVGGPCADTNKDFPKDYREIWESNWQSVHLLHSPTISIAFSFYFSSANNIMREKLHHFNNKTK